MRKVAYGIPWIPKNLVASFVTTKWKFLDYTKKQMSYEDVNNEKPEVIISFSPPEQIRSQPTIKWLITPGAGIDKLPIDKINLQKQVVINCHANSNTVAEHAWALLLAVSRNIVKYDTIVRQQEQWPNRNQIHDVNYDLYGKTLGIIGYGEIAKQLHKFAQAFDMEVVIFRKHPENNQFHYSTLIENLDELDYLIIACPLTEESRNLVSQEVINSLPSHCIIVNIARGEIMDEDALINALKEGDIRGAGIDVWKNSPYGGKDGLPPSELVTIPNLIISPHRAWVSKDSYGMVAKQIAKELDLIALKKKSSNIVVLNRQY